MARLGRDRGLVVRTSPDSTAAGRGFKTDRGRAPGDPAAAAGGGVIPCVPTPEEAMRLGTLKLTLVGDGGFRLDGGAMFGVVPKVLWQRVKPADERNRIKVALRSKGSLDVHLLAIEFGWGR